LIAMATYGVFDEHDMGQRKVTFEIIGGVDSLTIPVPSQQTVGESKQFLIESLCLAENTLINFAEVNEGSTPKPLTDNSALIPNSVCVSGISSFRREKHSYPHPLGIISAGMVGMRMALMCKEEKVWNFCVFDRHQIIGGQSWVINANPQTRVQTELGVYHMDYAVKGKENVFSTKGMSVWPHRDDVRRHMRAVTEAYELEGNLRLGHDIQSIEIHDIDLPTGQHSYTLNAKVTDEDEDEVEEEQIKVSSISLFPGTLTRPRRETYKGEEDFGGSVTYGMFTETKYAECKGSDVVIVGMGAFSVENVRTCVENKASKIYQISRRKNLMMPRCISWWINGSLMPIPAKAVLDGMLHCYQAIGEDPFGGEYYSVQPTSKDGSKVLIHQKSRFGIGDVYFLARIYGKLELVMGKVKELSKNTVHVDMNDGTVRDLTASMLIKVLGFTADPWVDEFLQMKKLVGFWCEGDGQRAVASEFPEMHAQAFGGTSLAPFACGISYMLLHMLLYPKDFDKMIQTGNVPVHAQEEKYGWVFPANVLDAKLGTMTMMMVQGLAPFAAERLGRLDMQKRDRLWGTHSLEEVQAEAEMEWNRYCQQFYDEGDTRPFPPYLFSVEKLRGLVESQDKGAKEQFERMQKRQ